MGISHLAKPVTNQKNAPRAVGPLCQRRATVSRLSNRKRDFPRPFGPVFRRNLTWNWGNLCYQGKTGSSDFCYLLSNAGLDLFTKIVFVLFSPAFDRRLRQIRFVKKQTFEQNTNLSYFLWKLDSSSLFTFMINSLDATSDNKAIDTKGQKHKEVPSVKRRAVHSVHCCQLKVD